jgi:hypothetical protein
MREMQGKQIRLRYGCDCDSPLQLFLLNHINQFYSQYTLLGLYILFTLWCDGYSSGKEKDGNTCSGYWEGG